MRIKICGLSTPETLEATIAAGADMAGFVFFERSPRNLSLEKAALLGKIGAGRIEKIALVVDASDETIAAIVAALQPDMLQLQGQETPRRIAGIRERFGLPVMKAFGISGAADLEGATSVGKAADVLLLDAKPPQDAALPGGNGMSFDWSLLANFTLPQPWMLAGGLDAENVAQAIQVTRTPGVDVSSAVESAPGVKDIGKIEAFIRAARGKPYFLATAR